LRGACEAAWRDAVNVLHTLVVVSHVVHYRSGGALHAYGPYAREIDIWADLFPEVVIAAPCRTTAPTGDCTPFTRPNITMAPLMEAGGDTRAAKMRLALALPAIALGLARTMRRADAIHVRCPGSFGLLGVVLAPLFSRRRVAKYAGQWDGFPGEAWPGRLERFLLRSRWWGSPVVIYGARPGEPDHIVPFFTSMMTTRQVRHAASVACGKHLETPLRVLFSGVLEPRKRVDALLEGARIAADRGLSFELAIVGDGAERDALVRRAEELDVSSRVRFVGAVSFERALEWHEWAHCLVLPSRHSEGWPKVVAEAMTYGVCCIAVAHGHVPAMLHDRGVLLASGSALEIADALCAVAADTSRYEAMARRGSDWACGYSLEGMRGAIADLLTARWGVPVTVHPDRVEVSA
jgi:glycosyltransferase involved in cell wall biosynthesis